MKLCGQCGEWDFKPGRLCQRCGKPFTPRGEVMPPKGQRTDGNVRTSTKTPRQERDDT
jgi:hypothetical protein